MLFSLFNGMLPSSRRNMAWLDCLVYPLWNGWGRAAFIAMRASCNPLNSSCRYFVDVSDNLGRQSRIGHDGNFNAMGEIEPNFQVRGGQP